MVEIFLARHAGLAKGRIEVRNGRDSIAHHAGLAKERIAVRNC